MIAVLQVLWLGVYYLIALWCIFFASLCCLMLSLLLGFY